jgi:hypothetical protein
MAHTVGKYREIGKPGGRICGRFPPAQVPAVAGAEVVEGDPHAERAQVG